jgi:hypothetical protein
MLGLLKLKDNFHRRILPYKAVQDFRKREGDENIYTKKRGGKYGFLKRKISQCVQILTY